MEGYEIAFGKEVVQTLPAQPIRRNSTFIPRERNHLHVETLRDATYGLANFSQSNNAKGQSTQFKSGMQPVAEIWARGPPPFRTSSACLASRWTKFKTCANTIWATESGP